MSQRLLSLVLVLLMLAPSGACNCQAGARSGWSEGVPIPVALVPVLKPAATNCCGGHHEPGSPSDGPEDHPAAPSKGVPLAPDHDPSCPAAQQPVSLAAVRDTSADQIVPLAEPATCPCLGVVPAATIAAIPPPYSTGEPLPLYLRLCTLLI